MTAARHPESSLPSGMPPPQLRVYVNRNLRMSSIAAIGFDMDHTLALYNAQTFERLSFELALSWLIERRGYPEEIRALPYQPEMVCRGLIVDKRLGHLLKTDAYGYVSRVRHGRRLLTREERRQTYKRGRLRLSPDRYRIFDTLFDLPEGCLYIELVSLKDERPELVPASYRVLFNDIREAIDTIHRDGTLKRMIMADLDRFFVRDPGLAETLARFRTAGKKLFLLTNSETDYTAAVMSHILDGQGAAPDEMFDLIICSSRKPEFFVQQGKGRPVPRDQTPGLANRRGNCFTGGDAFFLESKLDCFGDAILYFGDHTYGDILRSKKSVGWRTALIVPELEREIAALQSLRGELRGLEEVEARLEELSLARERRWEEAASAAENGAGPPAFSPAPEEAAGEAAFAEALQRRGALQKRLAAAFNPYWGSLFKEGRAASRFGAQVKDFACIYTSRVSNLRFYPVDRFFVNPGERMPHEL